MKSKQPETVYEKLAQMAEKEAAGREKIDFKDLCKGIAKRFRLNNHEVKGILEEMNSNSKTRLGELHGRGRFEFSQ